MRLVPLSYGLAVLVIALDQATKYLASSGLSYAQPRPVFSWFDLTLHHNEGAAFSFLSGAGGWQRWLFAILAVLVSGVLVAWIRELRSRQWVLGLGLALVLGGALGNLVDRLLLGYVVDFISVHYAGRYFPTFNIADAAISVGAALIVVDSLWGQTPGEPAEKTE